MHTDTLLDLLAFKLLASHNSFITIRWECPYPLVAGYWGAKELLTVTANGPLSHEQYLALTAALFDRKPTRMILIRLHIIISLTLPAEV
jgi:hypothetical protein